MTQNLICNGDFEDPVVNNGAFYFDLFSSIPCWTSSINSFELNKDQNGMTGQGMDLDVQGQANQYFDQTVNVAEAGNYFLTLYYTGNQMQTELPSMNMFEVLFNGVVIFDIVPDDLDVHTLKATIVATAGNNVLRLKNKSTTSHYGALVDNVGFYKIIYK